MEKSEIIYKEFVIRATPLRLLNGKWEMNVDIRRNGFPDGRPFSAGNQFSSEDEAIEHALNFGRQIIDGKIENRSVNDL